ncbi:NrdH-redoxin [Candidatus Azambacteria bacterium RIFCSPHIGHO2_02_FULL_52_12]|uniref:NrdH-redoxin n=1 Tax=Candidatus Azambacteria bacterium RIFCSPLOWO2_01_FULL_46_25 TaxID=1797298 RepID=A0A1F5BW54_9BACT|nr:MAG: NrdH-redoxin [Candidatus Azambacteria bacterium RIFCSPHIGHO2_02_FULL_52_12]OGD34844.1 MAG: NrdH-redoxin [Candidatus Azambacteria bacterium RIFCSPLOWO2_01_FULL_46_25]OGD37896.1 MAG: NrdH-redoxin [Candidatus Azambacteria bacterium RIFCSPHIGHO2_01_FULL_51_74]
METPNTKPAVTIYTTPTCVYCKMAKDYFTQNNIAYQELDVAVDEKAREDMVEKSGQMGVPVIDVGGTIVIGFDQDLLAQLLQIKQ